MLKEFKEFAVKGSVLDLAVAVIIATALGKIISSLVGDLLMPLIGVFMGGVSFAELRFSVGNAQFAYGNFIQSIVDFIIIAFVIFMIIKTVNKFKKKEIEEKPPAPSTEEVLLTEIRDILRADK